MTKEQLDALETWMLTCIAVATQGDDHYRPTMSTGHNNKGYPMLRIEYDGGAQCHPDVQQARAEFEAALKSAKQEDEG